MRGFIGNTDYDWYRFLAAQPDIDEVNFWQPSGGGGRFVALSAGEPFFFRLKSPHNAIAGFGYFAIGCIMVASPVFFPQELWVHEPADWAPNIVRGHGEDLTRGDAKGLRLQLLLVG